jgi:hypothetical protein
MSLAKRRSLPEFIHSQTDSKDLVMQFKVYSPLFIAASMATLVPNFALAESISSRQTATENLAVFGAGVPARGDSGDDKQELANETLRRLVKQMLIRRTTMDICDKGTGKCK